MLDFRIEQINEYERKKEIYQEFFIKNEGREFFVVKTNLNFYLYERLENELFQEVNFLEKCIFLHELKNIKNSSPEMIKKYGNNTLKDAHKTLIKILSLTGTVSPILTCEELKEYYPERAIESCN